MITSRTDDEAPTVPTRLVMSRIAECYTPGSGRPLDLWRTQYLVVHHCSLSVYEAGANEHPIDDDLLDGPALAGRFRNPGLGTGGRCPYHFLVRRDGIIEQMLPLSVRGAHAARKMPDGSLVTYNDKSVAVAMAGEGFSLADQDTIYALCALLRPIAGGLSVVGHAELPNASRDVKKACPVPTVNMDGLRAQVDAEMPTGWQLLDRASVEGRLSLAGVVI